MGSGHDHADEPDEESKADLDTAKQARRVMEEAIAEAQGRITLLEHELAGREDIQAELGELQAAYDRLRNRRVVRWGLALASIFRPLFRLIRGQVGGERRTPTTRPVTLGSRHEGRAVAPAHSRRPVPDLLAIRPKVTVIIPVYGAADELRRCVDSVVRNTSGDCELLILDDASPDPEVREFLAELQERYQGLSVAHNDENLGFVRTVNRGFEMTAGDVVILNSDTEVPPGWIGRLQRLAYSDPTVGSVTPLSDNAGAFSAPVRGILNDMPSGIDDMGRLVARYAEHLAPEVPTGNGFCMYLKREMLDDTGGFDAESFPRGYGEENDLSMRASRLGWKHLVDDATIVFHVRSASFREDKAELVAKGREAVDALHPDYGRRVQEFLRDPSMERARGHVGRAVAAARSGVRPLPRILYVMHAGRGGTPRTNEDLMAGVSRAFDPLLLSSDGRKLVLREGLSGALLEEVELSDPLRAGTITSSEYRDVMARLLDRYAVEVVHIRHLQRHTFDLPEVATLCDIPVVLSFHDFYYVCPTVHLLDETDTYCGGVCTQGQGSCRLPYWSQGLPHLKHGWVKVWQEKSREMFKYVDFFVTTTQSAAEVYRSVFGNALDARFEVIEHGRNLMQRESMARFPEAGEPARVLVLGHIGVHKGARLIAEIQSLDSDRRLEFHLLGTLDPEVDLELVDHGPYERDEIEARIRDIRPAVVALLSISPETYSHTLTEAWSLGLPVVGSDFGAIKARIESHGGGWTVDVSRPRTVYEFFVALFTDREEWERQRNLASIEGLPTVDDMAGQYIDVYRRAQDRLRSIRVARS